MTADELAETCDRIRQAYWGLVARPGQWVDLVDLRADLPSWMSRAEVDEALRALIDDRDVRIEPDPLTHRLTPARKAASVAIGGEDRYKIAIGEPW